MRLFKESFRGLVKKHHISFESLRLSLNFSQIGFILSQIARKNLLVKGTSFFGIVSSYFRMISPTIRMSIAVTQCCT
jgi:hypothetical protein